MITTSIRARAFACALLATTAYCGLAPAAASAQAERPNRNPDVNGVDPAYGALTPGWGGSCSRTPLDIVGG